MIGLLLGVALASAAPPGAKLAIDGPLAQAAPCAEAAPVSIVEALREGVSLPWRRARVLFPEVGLERALARRVIVRAARVGVCGGRVIAEDVTARIVGPRAMPIEVAVATQLRPGPVLAVTEDDVQVRPPPGTSRITARDTWTAYGAWDLGAVHPRTASSAAAAPIQSQLSM